MKLIEIQGFLFHSCLYSYTLLLTKNVYDLSNRPMFLRVVSLALSSPCMTRKETARKKILGAKRAEGKSSDKDREFDLFGQNNFSM